MLHILLVILKILGIVIACLLGLVILLLLAILFAPIRYKAEVNYYDKLTVNAKVSWLLFIRGLVRYDEELSIKGKALFFTVYSNENKEDVPKKEKKKKKDKADNVFDIPDDTGPANASVNINNSNNTSDNNIKSEKTNINNATNELDNNIEADIDNMLFGEEDYKEFDEAHEKSKNGIIEFIKNIYNKIKDLLDTINGVFHKVESAGEKLKKKTSDVLEMVNDEGNKELIGFLWSQVKALLKILMPKIFRVKGRLGFEDPATTGQAFMYISILYGLSGMDLELVPVFGEDVKEGNVYIKGKFRLFPILRIALKVYRNKQFKKIISR